MIVFQLEYAMRVRAVITAKDVESIYEVPLVLSGEGLDGIILRRLGLESRGRDMRAWEDLVRRIKNPRGEVVIGCAVRPWMRALTTNFFGSCA